MTGTATYVNPFQSTLSVRRATAVSHGHLRQQNISIHALRKESDHRRVRLLLKPRYFNPRSP